MPRPRKNPATSTTAKPTAAEKEQEGLVTLSHFAKSGTVFVDGEKYAIKDGKVSVKPEHANAVREHIRLGS